MVSAYKQRLGGIILTLMANLSNIALPYSTIDFFNSQVEYYNKNPENKSPYLGSTVHNARYDAGMLGVSWGTGNMVMMTSGVYFICLPRKRDSDD